MSFYTVGMFLLPGIIFLTCILITISMVIDTIREFKNHPPKRLLDFIGRIWYNRKGS